ncbi:MAG: hypothetical protein NTY81_02275 [Candidatus Staskawiczbacteria bacterium]|nr:hypothetical protein [Candidatus Staskawiczbacteria bacterium]
MGKLILIIVLLLCCVGLSVFYAVDAYKDIHKEGAFPANTASTPEEKARGGFIETSSEIDDLKKEVNELKNELAEEIETLPKVMEVIEKNKDEKDQTEAVVLAGRKYSLGDVRRDVYLRTKNIKALQTEISAKEAKIAELQKRVAELKDKLYGIKKELLPNDDELLKQAQEVLEPPPAPAK